MLLRIVTVLLSAVCMLGACTAQKPSGPSQYGKLIWSDEFKQAGAPDSTKWNYNFGRGCPDNCGWGNNELQYYTNSRKNVWVEDGRLHIKAIRENFKDAAFTSARLLTKNKFEFTYGRVEVRAKLPAGIGTWPAAWMLGANIDQVDWPSSGEIDIMEHKGYKPGEMYGTFHYPGRSGEKADGKTIMLDDVSSDFHVYAAEWSADAISIYADGKLIHTLKNDASLPFHKPFFILLNFAMGGGFGGPVDPAFTEAVYEVDYVRVYQ